MSAQVSEEATQWVCFSSSPPLLVPMRTWRTAQKPDWHGAQIRYLLALAGQAVRKHRHLLAEGGRGRRLAMRAGKHGHVCKLFCQLGNGFYHLNTPIRHHVAPPIHHQNFPKQNSDAHRLHQMYSPITWQRHPHLNDPLTVHAAIPFALIGSSTTVLSTFPYCVLHVTCTIVFLVKTVACNHGSRSRSNGGHSNYTAPTQERTAINVG